MLPSAFGIKLAAVAYRKENGELEKWLNSNLSTYKDVFFEVIFNWSLPCCTIIYAVLFFILHILHTENL